MTDTLESIVKIIHDLGPANGQSRDAHAVVEGRLYLARGPNGRLELFVEGDVESFGSAAIGRSLEWGTYEDLNQARAFSALVVHAHDTESGTRLMAHLAYEATRLVLERPSLSNSELLVELQPFIALVLRRELLSLKQQMGLVAELLMLQELINFAASQSPKIDPRLVLESWKGWDSASRDFSGPGIAVEVKAAGRDDRRHIVHPMYQLLPDEDEEVYLYSVGLRPDRSRSFKLITAIDRVLETLDSDSRLIFLEFLREYGGTGYDEELKSQYELEMGFLIIEAAELFRVDHLPDILRPECFVGGKPPGRVSSIRYKISLEGLPPCRGRAKSDVLGRLLGLAS